MNPYLMEELVKERVERLRREAAAYRLGREVLRRRPRRVSRPLPVAAAEANLQPIRERARVV